MPSFSFISFLFFLSAEEDIYTPKSQENSVRLWVQETEKNKIKFREKRNRGHFLIY